jgi:hypothetical protein
VHAAELPPERGAVRDHIQQDEIRLAPGEAARDHRALGRRGFDGPVWKSIDRYSKDYIELQTKDKVRFYKTPDSILRSQLTAYDAAVAKRADNALFNEISESQKKYAERVVKWDFDTNVRPRDGVQPLLRQAAAHRRRADRRKLIDSHPVRAGWLFFFRPGRCLR